MKHVSIKSTLACFLVLCILAVGGLASAQSVTHESQHSHHQKGTHGTLLCSWMCAAGQVLDSTAVPILVEQSPVARVEQPTFLSAPRLILDSPTSRGPPSFPII
ncbi:hypothetical protein [Petrachloros mirabilis]